ncbi:ATP-binding cassette domain-containing protein [Halieaceae bacterium IMCC14734]|uniref:ATP-binding cassette domain-containing protein n=1 Tax=Candidatus Litorirhabdus singularis TaxID=2518993 RepID=A0ABT3TBX9_9GAMM|nr:ABC transporter transmembrane domain-containing protein [Candidatus Litorirhabdus singularis]MCX2979797.1 ATP-binding cassette domain-containing protein [Candidatus Litorirhabdus singularis]
MTEPAKGTRKLSTLLQLVQFLSPYKGTMIAAAVALIFTAAITLSVGQGIRIIIDEGFASGSQQQLNRAVVILLTLSFLMAIGTFIRFYLVSWLGERVSADMRSAVFSNIIKLHPSFFEDNRSGEIMSRLTTDTTLLQTIIGSSLSMALRSSLTLVGAMVMLLVTNLKLTGMVLACVPLVLMPIILYGRRVRNLSNASQDSIAHVGSYAGEIIQNLKTVQSYTREDFETKAFDVEVENAFLIARRRIRQRAVLMAVVILLVFGGLSAMFWVGGNDVINGTMSGGELAAFVFYAIMVATAVATISEVWGELMRAAGATDRLLDLLHEDSLIVEQQDQILPLQGAARLHIAGVSFSYPSRPEELALKDLELDVEEGKSLALVGPSGAGKSTVFELLQRFYDPQQGRILLGGQDIRALPSRQLRQSLAVVPQAPAMFTADVAYNIGYGKPDATEAEIIAAAKAAHADEFIRRLPQGYQSHLGEQGVRLSGGQRQRIAIARAILKDPNILLLDEATSALDAESEYQVQLALEELMHNRTTIIIAHRLSTILHADQIAVMEHGQVVARGTHQSLLASSDLYQRLARLQFQDEAVA